MKMAAQLHGQPFLIFRAFSGITAFAHHMYFSGIAIVIVWRFQNEGEFTEAGMADDGCECVKADAALTETGMAVLVARERIQAVVQMNGPQSLQTEHSIKFG